LIKEDTMPSNTAFLFPGQGRIPEALPPNIDRLSELLAQTCAAGLHLEEWMETGQADRLKQTDASQPALLLDNLSRDLLLRDAGWEPSCVAGHSLGEYAALASAGVLSPLDTMRAVIKRGKLMNDVQGSMAAILKLDLDTVAQLCKDNGAVVANHNAATQIVVSGSDEAVQAVMQQAEAAGGRSIALNVSGPFHSPQMQPAEDALSSLLQELTFSNPNIHVISGVSGQVERTPDALKQLLIGQITARVRWVDVSNELEQQDIETAIEVGSGDVLTRLGRRSGSSIRFLTFEEAIHAEI